MPEKEKIGDLVADFISDSPLFSAFSDIQIGYENTSSSVDIGEAFGVSLGHDFGWAEPTLRNCGKVLVSVAQAGALISVFFGYRRKD